MTPHIIPVPVDLPMYLNLEPRAWTGIETIFKPVTGRTRSRLGYDGADRGGQDFELDTAACRASGRKVTRLPSFISLASEREMQIRDSTGS